MSRTKTSEEKGVNGGVRKLGGHLKGRRNILFCVCGGRCGGL